VRFSPIAIVGRACLLPGADSPRALWRAVREGADLLDELPREAPEIAASTGRWRIDPARVLREGSDPTDATWTTRGGHVQAFEPEPSLEGLDALFHWVLRTARGALEDAGFTAASHPRAGAVLGNLSFPTCEMSRFAEAVWSGAPRPDPRNRFMSGLPALLLEEALALDAGAFALDAACASSLYAIKHAADALHDGRADLMLAGAVNRADDLFLHMGFAAVPSTPGRTGLSPPKARASSRSCASPTRGHRADASMA
jgi:acyl transferase domain-containing protein